MVSISRINQFISCWMTELMSDYCIWHVHVCCTIDQDSSFTSFGVMTYWCQHGKAPQCLVNCYTPVSDVPARQHLRSSSRHHLDVPRHRMSTYCQWAFFVAGPSVWNSLPVESSVIQTLALAASDDR